jgi:hypothetical protein
MISKGKCSFIKDDMPGNDGVIGGEIKATECFVLVGKMLISSVAVERAAT